MSRKITINLVVLNGEKYIRHALNSIKEQTYKDFEVNIFDNNSTDQTKKIAKEEFPEFNLIENDKNWGVWPGHDKALEYSHGEYIVAMSVDIILNKDFLKNSVEIMDNDPKIGALEPKLYQYQILEVKPVLTKKIDTLGFQIFRSRRITNIAHGEEDSGQYDSMHLKEVFAVEGAVPVFRREALEDIRIEDHLVDDQYFWYGDDLDLAWRMRLFGWKEVLANNVIAYHDRSTTKSANPKNHWWTYLSRLGERGQIPIKKRRLDWRNVRFTILKNEHIINLLRDLPFVLYRELQVLVYSTLFEPQILLEIPNFLRSLPRILRHRRLIMQKVKVNREEIRKWYIH